MREVASQDTTMAYAASLMAFSKKLIINITQYTTKL